MAKKKARETKIEFSKPQTWLRADQNHNPGMPMVALVLMDDGSFDVGYWSPATSVWYGVEKMYGEGNTLPVIAYAMLPDPLDIIEFLSLQDS